MQILVTGGAGFIGSNYVRYVLESSEDTVVTLDTLTYAGSEENLDDVLDHPRHEFVKGDIRDAELVEELVSSVDAVVNFAAETHVDRSIQDSEPFVSTNVEGTRCLLDAAANSDIQKFVQVSTDEVYGEIMDGAFDEEDPLTPRNPYAATKAAADHLAHSYFVTHDVPVVVTRSCNNYGPRQNREKLVPKFLSNANSGDALPVYGEGDNVREWIYVRDNCRGIDVVVRSGQVGEVYNIGSGIEKTTLEVTEAILDVVGASADLVTFVEDRAGHDQRYALDTEKVEQLGWEPEYSFDEGLRETADFYLT
jgi:dTDP-glucose 4,6-dehydratase